MGRGQPGTLEGESVSAGLSETKRLLHSETAVAQGTGGLNGGLWWSRALGRLGMFRSIWGQEVISPLALKESSSDPGRHRPLGPEGSRPGGTLTAPRGEPWPAGRQ